MVVLATLLYKSRPGITDRDSRFTSPQCNNAARNGRLGIVKLNRDGSFNIIGRIVDGNNPLPLAGVVLRNGDAIETKLE